MVENKHSGLFHCTPAEKAATHIARLEDIRKHPGKVIALNSVGRMAQ
jgi:hypothetical protein